MKRIISIFLMIALLAPYVAVETSKAETKESQTEWNIQRIRAEQSYEDSKKAEKIRVALLDSGVDLDDDIECEEQEDFIDNTGEETNFLMGDSNGHGTAVAGIICARKSEDRICGMAANVELYSAKILDEQNEAPIERVVKAIQWAIEKKVNIIHMSFATTEYSPELKKAVEDARQAGILLIAPAGNAGSADEDESSVMYPAAWDSVISVGSTDDMNEKSAFSPTGEGLDIMAPGEKILSTGAFGGIIVEEGTSLAAAQVTGAASVLWGLYRDKGADFIRKLLVQSANQTLGDKENFGEGLLDYERAKNNYEKLDVKNWNTEEIYGSNDEVRSGTKCHYVTGQWKGKRHSSQFINANNSKKSVSDNDIKLIKIAVCAPDSISRMKSYSLHPCFHGGKNYIANTEYILYSAYKLGKKDNKVRYQDVFPNNVDLYKNEKGKEDVQKELSQATKQQLFKYCKKKARKKKALTAKQKSLILLGVAIHNATDAVSHRAYKKVSFNMKIKKDKDDKEITKKYDGYGPIVHSSEDVTNPNVKAKAVDTVWGNLNKATAFIDGVKLNYAYLKKELAIADIVEKSKKHPVIMPSELRSGAQRLASSMLGYWNGVKSDGDARVIAKSAFNVMVKKMDSSKVKLADFNKYWNAVSSNENKKFKVNRDTEAVTEPKISKKNMVMKDKMLQSFSFKRIKDTGYLAYEMVKNKAVLCEEPDKNKGINILGKKVVFEKKSKVDTRQVIVVANKALRFKTTKLEYKRTIQYADAKKIDAIKKKKKVKQVTQYYKKDSTYKIKSPYVLKKGYQLKGFSLRKSKKGKIYKDKGKLPWGCGTAIKLYPIVEKKKKKKKG